MHVDLGTVLGTTPGLSEHTLEQLNGVVGQAHERIQHGRANSEHGYTALSLPDTVNLDQIRSALSRFESPQAIVVIGIGGSALGAATLVDALGGEDDPPVHVLDNVDPDSIQSTLSQLPLQETVVTVISRSGQTAETLSNFLVVREAMKMADIDWTQQTLVITGESGNLSDLATQYSLPQLSVPDGVPGRFSVLSAVGLTIAAFLDIDVDAVVKGAADGEADLSGSIFETPGYAYGAVAHALNQRGAKINVMMPYAERLETFGEWFRQLWAESLAKDGVGQTPATALGATDQHSQLQLYRAGPPDKLVTLVRPATRDDIDIPETALAGLGYLNGESLGSLLDAEFEATEASLFAADVPAIRIEIDALDPHSLGRLLYEMEAACILFGELANISTFTQPAVEWGKRATRGLLRDASTAETETITDKQTFIIE